MKIGKKYINFDHTVHYNINGRKRYKRKLFLIFGILVLILMVCSVMFYFGNCEWDPDEGFSPTANPDGVGQVILIVLASLISVGALVATCVYCFIDIRKFYITQAAYWKTPRFKQAKAEALKEDMMTISHKKLKWYKKLGYINAAEKKEILEKQKMAKKGTEKPEETKTPN